MQRTSEAPFPSPLELPGKKWKLALYLKDTGQNWVSVFTPESPGHWSISVSFHKQESVSLHKQENQNYHRNSSDFSPYTHIHTHTPFSLLCLHTFCLWTHLQVKLPMHTSHWDSTSLAVSPRPPCLSATSQQPLYGYIHKEIKHQPS